MDIKVLIVDDHAVLRSGLSLLINAQEDMTVVGSASNGDEAMDIAVATQPDVVIMDISMAGESGLSVTLRMKQALPNTEIVMLSMYDDRDLVFNALKYGASGYVLKKAQELDLMHAIRVVHQGEVYLYPSAAKTLIEEFIQKVDRGEHVYDLSTLTPRESQIISRLAKGFSNKEISEELYISVKTVEAHKSKIMEKLKLKTRQELVSYAYKHGMLHFD